MVAGFAVSQVDNHIQAVSHEFDVASPPSAIGWSRNPGAGRTIPESFLPSTSLRKPDTIAGARASPLRMVVPSGSTCPCKEARKAGAGCPHRQDARHRVVALPRGGLAQAFKRLSLLRAVRCQGDQHRPHRALPRRLDRKLESPNLQSLRKSHHSGAKQLDERRLTVSSVPRFRSRARADPDRRILSIDGKAH